MSTDPVGRFSIIPSRAVLDTELPRPALLLLNALGIYSDKDGWCWPSQETLAELTEHSQQWVSKYILVLEKRNYVNVTRERDPSTGNWKGNCYQIRFDTHTTPEVVRDTTPGGSAAIQPLEVVKNAPTENAPMNAPLAASLRNEAWDTLVDVMGYPCPEGKESLWGAIVAKAKATGAPTQELQRRAAWIVTAWGNDSLTPAALLNQWERAGSPLNDLTPEKIEAHHTEMRRQRRRLDAARKDALER